MRLADILQRGGRWLLTGLIAYAFFLVGLMVFQRHLIYFPDRTAFIPAEWGMAAFTPVPLSSSDGLQITAWFTPPRDAAQPVLVFFQGNAGHPGFRNHKVRPWVEAGYGVMIAGYRGYARNPGRPTEQGLYADARAALAHLAAQGIPTNRQIYYGESLGTGVAVQMATEQPPLGLILEAPYTAIADVGQDRYPIVPIRWLLWDRFDSYAKISAVHAPLLLLHGAQDDIIPQEYGRRLFAAANEPKQAEWLDSAGHNDIYDIRVEQLVLRWIERLARTIPVAAGG